MAEMATMSDADLMALAKGGALRLVRLLELDAPAIILKNEYALLGRRITEIARRQELNEVTQGDDDGGQGQEAPAGHRG